MNHHRHLALFSSPSIWAHRHIHSNFLLCFFMSGLPLDAWQVAFHPRPSPFVAFLWQTFSKYSSARHLCLWLSMLTNWTYTPNKDLVKYKKLYALHKQKVIGKGHSCWMMICLHPKGFFVAIIEDILALSFVPDVQQGSECSCLVNFFLHKFRAYTYTTTKKTHSRKNPFFLVS